MGEPASISSLSPGFRGRGTADRAVQARSRGRRAGTEAATGFR